MRSHPEAEVSSVQRSILSRRAFLKTIGAGMAGLLAVGVLPINVATESGSEPADTPSILIDLTRCTGCGSCVLACQAENRLPATSDKPRRPDAYHYTVVTDHPTAELGVAQPRFVKRQCMHCLDPACVTACPAAAMYKSSMGAVVYRPDRCLGCRYCQIACPFGIPGFQWEDGLTPTIGKCWFCYERLQVGRQPACVTACPTGALRFGTRDELLAQAHAQIATDPDRYMDHIYGEHEMGGTSILYLSDIPFSELDFPANLPHEAPSEETEKVMGVLPAIIVGVGTAMVGATMITHRHSSARGETGQDEGTAPQFDEEE